MSLAEFYQKQCTDKLQENAALLLAKLSDPSSLVNINVSGALADAAGGGMGGLADFAKQYLQDNADVIGLEALKATGLEDSVLAGLNLFLNMLAQAMAAYNDLILIFLKQQAKSCQTQLRKKIEIDKALKPKLIGLINSLKAMDAGDPVFDAYLKKLRAALVQLNSGTSDIKVVRDNLASTNQFLPKLYRKGKKKIILAAQQIKPPTDSVKIIVPDLGQGGPDTLAAPIEFQHDGFLLRSEPNILRASESPANTTFHGVRTGDTVVVLASTNSTYVLYGSYTVTQKINDNTLKLDRNLFDTSKPGPVNQIGGISVPSGVNYYIKTIVKGTGAALKSAVVSSLGIPTEPQQIENLLSVPKQLKEIILSCKDYSVDTAKADALLFLYFGGLSALQTGIPDIMKKFVLSLFDKLLGRLGGTISSMAQTINGDQKSISRVKPGFAAQPLNVSVQAFKWALDLNLIVESMKLIPASTQVVALQGDGLNGALPSILISGKGPGSGEFKNVKPGDTVEIVGGTSVVPETYTVFKQISPEVIQVDRTFLTGTHAAGTIADIRYFIETDGALDQFAANQGIVAVYQQTVAQIKKLGTIQNGSASLVAHEGQEDIIGFQGQVLTFLLQTVPSVASSKVRKEVIDLGLSLVNRCDLAISRDTRIIQILQTFIDTPIPLEDTLDKILQGLNAMLKGLGLDKAADLFNNGDYTKLFGLNGKNATYIGAALEAIALLKNCVKTDAEKGKLDDAANNLAGQKDLLNIKVSINFDFAILQNIKDCLDLTNLAKLFMTQEFLCQILAETQSLATQAFDKLEDLMTPDSPTGDTIQTAPGGSSAFSNLA